MIDYNDYHSFGYVEYISPYGSGHGGGLDIEREYLHMHHRTGIVVRDREAFEEWLKGIENA